MPGPEGRNHSPLFKRLRVAFWSLEVLQLLLTIVTLGITGSASQGIKDDLGFPGIPTKLSYNIAMATITMIVLLLLVPLDIFYAKLPFWVNLNEIYSPWPRFALSLLLTIFWIGCVASSVYSCGDLCSAAEASEATIKYASLCCTCTPTGSFYSSCSADVGSGGGTYEPRTGRYEGAQATDALMLLSFIATSCILLSFRWLRTPLYETVNQGGAAQPGLQYEGVGLQPQYHGVNGPGVKTAYPMYGNGPDQSQPQM